MSSEWKPLPREEVAGAVDRTTPPSRIPLIHARWWGEGLGEQYGARLSEFDCVPEDAAKLWYGPVDPGRMELSWKMKEHTGGHDSRCLIDDWSRLDEFIEKLPKSWNEEAFSGLKEPARQARSQGQYILAGWWGLFFERPWGLRGMENVMMDYYTNPDEIHRLHDGLCNEYCRFLERAIDELEFDGFWTSDDLGHQTQLMMTPEVFHDLLKPYYARIGKLLHDNGKHFWLHSCGNNTDALEDLIDAGVDVFHPVQKGTMDEAAVARDYGDRMTFLVGFDVQHILQEGSTDDVRREVRHLIDTFDRPDGGMCLAAGNGIVGGTPFENIGAFLDESLRYGEAHRRQVAAV